MVFVNRTFIFKIYIYTSAFVRNNIGRDWLNLLLEVHKQMLSTRFAANIRHVFKNATVFEISSNDYATIWQKKRRCLFEISITPSNKLNDFSYKLRITFYFCALVTKRVWGPNKFFEGDNGFIISPIYWRLRRWLFSANKSSFYGPFDQKLSVSDFVQPPTVSHATGPCAAIGVGFFLVDYLLYNLI